MNTTTAVVLTAGITAAGYWAKDRSLPAKYYVGVGILTIGLAALGEINADFAQKFGMLLVVAALIIYIRPISEWLGFSK